MYVQCTNNHCANFEYYINENFWSHRLHKPDTPYVFRMEKMS